MTTEVISMDESKLLTEDELLAALKLNVARTTVWRWRDQGMPYVKLGRAIRYELGAVQEWMRREHLNLDRIIEIAKDLFTEQGGLKALDEWRPVPLDQFEHKLNNTIRMDLRGDLDDAYRFQIVGGVKEDDGSWEVEIRIERVQEVGSFKLQFPPGADVQGET
jgi:predicted DNA-binding transcriptional regulator AlpA